MDLFDWAPNCRFSMHVFGTNTMGLLPATKNCGLRMRRECRERFLHHGLKRKSLDSDPGMHHGSCVTQPANLRIWEEAHDPWFVQIQIYFPFCSWHKYDCPIS